MEKQRKKVVIITNIPSPYRVDFFDYLQRHTDRYEFHILYASRNEDNRSWEIDRKKMRNSHFLCSYTIKIPYRYDVKYIHISRGITAELRKLKPAVVVGSEYNPTILQALRYCLKKKIPYVSWTDGTLHSERHISRLQRLLRRYVIRHASAFIASSTKSKEAQLAYGADPGRCFISLLTADLEKYMPEHKKREENRLLCVGSLTERKGVDLLLKALAKIREEYRLVLAGSGPEEKKLKALAKRLGIENKVEFLGYLSREELKKEYERSAVFVLPTRQDCFALVILEALCAGLPAVCSRYADGAYDLIEEGKNGYIVNPYDTEAFCRRIRLLLRNPRLAERMGKSSGQILEKFRFEQVSLGFQDALACAAGKRKDFSRGT